MKRLSERVVPVALYHLGDSLPGVLVRYAHFTRDDCLCKVRAEHQACLNVMPNRSQT